jgi:hypothetical protein
MQRRIFKQILTSPVEIYLDAIRKKKSLDAKNSNVSIRLINRSYICTVIWFGPRLNFFEAPPATGYKGTRR